MRGLGVGLTPADFALVVDALDPNRSGSVDLRDLYKELCAAGCGRARSLRAESPLALHQMRQCVPRA
jgi:hypothetical protein